MWSVLANIKFPLNLKALLVSPSLLSFALIPKSINVNLIKELLLLYLAQIFSGFKSPWEYPRAWIVLSPSMTYRSIETTKSNLLSFVLSLIYHLLSVAPPWVIRISPWRFLILNPSSCGSASWKWSLVFLTISFRFYLPDLWFLSFSSCVKSFISLIISKKVSP